jgi:tetratricopeptide (TPR) repeat protein
VAELPEGYKEVPEEDRIKAKGFFGHGKKLGATGNFEYAIEMFLQGLNLDPDDVEAHQELRDLSLKRKVSGGKSLGMFEVMKLKRGTKDDKQNMLNAEKLMAYDPGNTDNMQHLMDSAYKSGYFDTMLWIGPIFQKANVDDKKPDLNKFLALRDLYKNIRRWKLAADAAQYALQLRPLDMDLATEVKNLGAMETMDAAGYSKGGSFRDQVRDKDKQQRLMISEKDHMDSDAMAMLIADAEAQYKAEPEDPGKAMRLVDTLDKTDQLDSENRAIELLQKWFDKTRQFRYRLRIGQINMKQMRRMEMQHRKAIEASPQDEQVRKDYTDFMREKAEFELKEYELATEAYPTEMRWKYEVAKRLFALGRFQDSIPVFQQARNDPKYRVDAGQMVGRAFFEAGFLDEADDTIAQLIRDYQLTGDEKSKEMYYWRARILEQKNMTNEALQHYSRVAQWDFGYRDVQARIKKLKS